MLRGITMEQAELTLQPLRPGHDCMQGLDGVTFGRDFTQSIASWRQSLACSRSSHDRGYGGGGSRLR